jgi:hypothetical protein
VVTAMGEPRLLLERHRALTHASHHTHTPPEPW